MRSRGPAGQPAGRTLAHALQEPEERSLTDGAEPHETGTLVTVGYVRSDLKDRAGAPRQGRDAGAEAWVEVLEPFADGLLGLEDRERILVLCWLHLADRGGLRLRPRGDPSAPLTGVFSTRSPNRPNPLAVYPARLLEVKGRWLRVAGLDAVDGTPVVDLKPYVPRLDE